MERKSSTSTRNRKSIKKITDLVKISEFNGEPTPCTTSLKIAEVFGKEHFHIRREIEKLAEIGEFNASNFGCVEYEDKKGEKRPMYLLDELFATVLMMGFTGVEAVKWKIAYTKEFQRMRKQQYKQSRIIRTSFDDPAELNKAVNHVLLYTRNALGEKTKRHHYMALAENVNEFAFGDRGKGKELRKNMNLQEYQRLNRTLSGTIKGLLNGNIHKKELHEYLEKTKVLKDSNHLTLEINIKYKK